MLCPDGSIDQGMDWDGRSTTDKSHFVCGWSWLTMKSKTIRTKPSEEDGDGVQSECYQLRVSTEAPPPAVPASWLASNVSTILAAETGQSSTSTDWSNLF